MFPFSVLLVPRRDGRFPFPTVASHIGRVPTDFQNARPASGKSQTVFRIPVPCRDSRVSFFFGRFLHRESRPEFPLAVSRVGKAPSDFRWPCPASGKPFRRRPSSCIIRLLVHTHVAYLSFISFQSRESVFGKKREHFHKRNALLRTPHPLREHYRKLLMPTPIRSELRSLRHSRIVDVVFQEDAKNYRLFIPKRSNSECKNSKKSSISHQFAKELHKNLIFLRLFRVKRYIGYDI